MASKLVTHCCFGFGMKNSVSGIYYKWVLSRQNNASCGYYCLFKDTWKRRGQIIVQITAFNEFLNCVQGLRVTT